jgi:hypothetical protein
MINQCTVHTDNIKLNISISNQSSNFLHLCYNTIIIQHSVSNSHVSTDKHIQRNLSWLFIRLQSSDRNKLQLLLTTAYIKSHKTHNAFTHFVSNKNGVQSYDIQLSVSLCPSVSAANQSNMGTITSIVNTQIQCSSNPKYNLLHWPESNKRKNSNPLNDMSLFLR